MAHYSPSSDGFPVRLSMCLPLTKDDELDEACQKDHRNRVSQLWCPEPSFPMHVLGQGKAEKEEQNIVSCHTCIPESFEHCLEDWLCSWATFRTTFHVTATIIYFLNIHYGVVFHLIPILSHYWGCFESRHARPLTGCLGIDGCPKFWSNGCMGKGYCPRTETVWPSLLPSCFTNHCERTGLGILHKWCGKVVSWWNDWFLIYIETKSDDS